MKPCRGKPVDKSMEWVYGWYLQCEKGKHYIMPIPIITWKHVGILFAPLHFEVIPETVGQSIDLEVKYGKDLDWWEDDIIKFTFEYGFIGNLQKKTEIGLIVYVNGKYMLRTKKKDYELSFVIDSFNKEVIGNKTDDPQLLEEQNVQSNQR